MYNIYELKINPKSSFMSKLQSDTIWGHIIWAIRYIEGEEYLNEVLREFKNNNSPFIVSDGFASGYFPFIKKGIMTIMQTKKVEEKRNDLNKSKIKLHTKLVNQFNKVDYIDLETFNKLRDDKIVSKVYSEVLTNKRCPITLKRFSLEAKDSIKLYMTDIKEYIRKFEVVQYNDLIKTVSITKNKINRLTNSSEQEDGSGLFTVYETFYNTSISIYIKLRSDIDINRFKTYLEYIEESGFGKKSSVGKGQFDIISFNRREDLEKNQYLGNGFVVLSNYIPKENDYKEVIGCNTITKRGKVHSQGNNVFKKPFMCFSAGSVFRGNVIPNKGRVLTNLYYDNNIVQCGIPFILGVNLNE